MRAGQRVHGRSSQEGRCAATHHPGIHNSFLQSLRPLWVRQLWEQQPLVFLSQLECPHESQPSCSGNFLKHEASTADESTASASSAPLDEWNLAPVRSLGSNPQENFVAVQSFLIP